MADKEDVVKNAKPRSYVDVLERVSDGVQVTIIPPRVEERGHRRQTETDRNDHPRGRADDHRRQPRHRRP